MGGGASKAAGAADCEVLETRGRVLRARRHDKGAEGLIPAAMRKRLPAVTVLYADGFVSWWSSVGAARAGELPVGVIPKGSSLFGLELSDHHDPHDRTFTRFLAEVDPAVGVTEADAFEAGPTDDPVAVAMAELSGRGPMVVVEAWARVPSRLIGSRPDFREHEAEVDHPLFAPTLVPVESIKNAWPVPTVLGPAPGSEPVLEREADAILVQADTLYQAGDVKRCLKRYTESATAASRDTYTVRTRKQQRLGTGDGTSFLKSPKLTDRSIHRADEETCWRAIEESGGCIQLECGLWLPKDEMVLKLTPLDQLATRAFATAGMLVGMLELGDYAAAHETYNLFKSDEGIRDFCERSEVASALGGCVYRHTSL
jgi:hypothetical protein